MARDAGWQHEVRDALRREDWALHGPGRVVKVVPLAYTLATEVSGYVCLEKVLVGKTPAQIGTMLGVKRHSLDQGLRAYRLRRLPLSHEVDYELTAKYPDGLHYNPAMHDANYPAGDPSVHQWKLLADIPAAVLLELQPGQRYHASYG